MRARNPALIDFGEPDEFAESLNGFETRYRPTTSDRQFTKIDLSLPSARLVIVTRPPMLFEGSVVAEHGVVTFQLEDELQASVNGGAANTDTIALWRKGTDYRGFQKSRLSHCSLFPNDDFSDRDWPALGGGMLQLAAGSASLRACVREVAEVAGGALLCMSNANVRKSIDCSINGCLDEALFAAYPSQPSVAASRYLAICRRVSEFLRESPPPSFPLVPTWRTRAVSR